MTTDLLIDAIERLEAAIAEAKETTRECHAARKDLKTAIKECSDWIGDPDHNPAVSRLLLEAWEAQSERVSEALNLVHASDRHREERLEKSVKHQDDYLVAIARAIEKAVPGAGREIRAAALKLVDES